MYRPQIQKAAVQRLPTLGWRVEPSVPAAFRSSRPGQSSAVERQLVRVLQTLQRSMWRARGAFIRLPQIFLLPRARTDSMLGVG